MTNEPTNSTPPRIFLESNMTQDEPERVEEIIERLRLGHVLTHRELIEVADLLSLSEKRAEIAEAETLSLMMDAVELRNDLERIISERDSSQASLLRVEKALAHVEQWLTAWGAPPEDKPDRDSWIRGRNRIVEVVRAALSPHKET